MTAAVLATGWSLHLPGVHPAEALAGALDSPDGQWAYQDSPTADKAAALLGRKGLLYKEPATRLALCAVHRALRLEPGERPGWPVDPKTAVVACSNLGNVETVAQVTRAIAAEGGQAVSVLDAPNVSSNVVASTVALWFGFGGPNLMVCSGTAAGLDGLRLARLLLRARRADRVVLVGTEPADDVATGLRGRPLRAAAACLVLERARPGIPAAARQVRLELGTADGSPRPRVTVGPRGFDPAAHWGDSYGAQGVVALALAAHLAADEGYGQVGVRFAGENGENGAAGALVTARAGVAGAATSVGRSA